ncbi:phosphotransferase [Catellatospora sp. KI3]|uniref:phosphotransferase n=1 Tax=Catellatospora sp. KI3 TaxID=3041620 RepID=UPI0024828351|nr:phosphotransferase [Catellatospora sp. KI3]MDI1460960.1 phosphotransferase [Catellatospora sp. KI3]
MTAPDDTAILDRVWRRCAGTATLTAVERLPGRSHRVYACTPDRGPALIVRLGDPGRARFALEAALMRRCGDSGVAVVPVVRHVGVEEAGGQAAAVMVLERVAGERLSEFARRVGPRRAAGSVARAGEALHAVHQVRTSGFGPLDAALGGPAARLGDWFIDGLADKARRARDVDRSGVRYAADRLRREVESADAWRAPGCDEQ